MVSEVGLGLIAYHRVGTVSCSAAQHVDGLPQPSKQPAWPELVCVWCIRRSRTRLGVGDRCLCDELAIYGCLACHHAKLRKLWWARRATRPPRKRLAGGTSLCPREPSLQGKGTRGSRGSHMQTVELTMPRFSSSLRYFLADGFLMSRATPCHNNQSPRTACKTFDGSYPTVGATSSMRLRMSKAVATLMWPIWFTSSARRP